MNIFYIGVDSDYVCDTSRSLREAIVKASDNTFLYGPGFLSDEDLNLGIEYWLNTYQPDIIITSDFVIGLEEDYIDNLDALKHLYPSRRLVSPHLSKRSFLFLLESVQLILHHRNAPLLITLIETDLYRATPSQVYRLSQADYYLGFGSQFTPPHNTLLASSSNEILPIRKFITPYAFDFAIENSSRTITILDFVPDINTKPTLLASRRNHWSVPGVQYHSRLTAIKSLKNAGINVLYGRSFLGRVFFHKIFPHALRTAALARYKSVFKKQIQTSRYSYTCGSSCQTPVTKFFEIPSLGTLLVGQCFYNSQAAGFIPGSNYIEAEPYQLSELHLWLTQRPDLAQQIATKGFHLVAARHTFSVRVKQINQCLSAIIEKKFSGNVWTNGSMTLL